MNERDIWLTSNAMIKRHEADAEIHAAMRAHALLQDGDIDGRRVWKRVITAIRGAPCHGA
jgi:hypothetical protein